MFPWCDTICLLAHWKRSLHLTVNKLGRYLASSAEIQQGLRRPCYLWQCNFSLFELSPVCPCTYIYIYTCVCVFMILLLKRDTGPFSLGILVSRFDPCCRWRQCSSHCLSREYKTKNSMSQCTHSKDGQESPYQLCSECHYLWCAYWEAPRASTRTCCVFCHAVSCLSTHFQGQLWKCTIGARR